VFVKNVEIMNFPQEELFGQMGPDEVEQTTPSLMPLVERKLEFTIIE
jgi:hypothetical protein